MPVSGGGDRVTSTPAPWEWGREAFQKEIVPEEEKMDPRWPKNQSSLWSMQADSCRKQKANKLSLN